MSKIFYDHLVSMEKVDKQIKKLVEDSDERIEFWKIIDEIIHHKVLGCIFDKLPSKDHEELITRIKKNPFDEKLIDFISEKIQNDASLLIKYEVKKLELEILEHFLPQAKKLKSKN